MLTILSIQNVVLIDQLTLNCAKGLSVLTGETGAGKSILLDALGLALGYRGEARLVRKGADKASVTAEFDIDANHPAIDMLRDSDIEIQTPVLLRRVLGSDGKSRAYINDQPVSVGLLKEIGETLVEIHGQFETQGLLNPKTHVTLLDVFGGTKPEATRLAWTKWQGKHAALMALRSDIEQAKQEEDFLRHAVDELQRLAPEAGEEQRLSEARGLIMNRDRLLAALGATYAALSGEDGAVDHCGVASGALGRVADVAGERFDKIIETLNRAESDLQEVISEIQNLSTTLEHEGQNADDIEERLFALKDLARKHKCEVDDLPDMAEQLTARLDALDNQETALLALEQETQEAWQTYCTAAQALSAARQKAAKKLDKAVNAELPPLKLDKAEFATEIAHLDEAQWGANGMDKIQFMIATNPGAAPGPLNKIASGGELARIMLAIKVVLTAKGSVPCLVFDEVDSGIGGATAQAVGERLKQLSDNAQVLVITHSPQVAAQGDQHWIVQKSEQNKTVTTTVVPLAANESQAEEIARMLSGATITAEARAQAQKLMEGGH